MRPREVEVVEAGIVDSLRRNDRPGIHLSDMLNYIRQGLDKKFKEALRPEDFHRFRMGEGFEAGVMNRGLKFRIKDKHEEHFGHVWTDYGMVVDGIHLTADGVCSFCRLVWEVKLTWLGMGRDVLDPMFRSYLYQLMAYVYAVQKEMKEKFMGRFVFGFVNGNYRDKRHPVILAWDMPWSKKELEHNWGMILRVRDEMGRLGLLKGKNA